MPKEAQRAKRARNSVKQMIHTFQPAEKETLIPTKTQPMTKHTMTRTRKILEDAFDSQRRKDAIKKRNEKW